MVEPGSARKAGIIEQGGTGQPEDGDIGSALTDLHGSLALGKRLIAFEASRLREAHWINLKGK